jgi:hypothetical protein
MIGQIKSPIVDCFLPASWYPHDVQAQLIGAGIKMPVFKKSTEKILAESDELSVEDVKLPGKTNMVYVPHFGDEAIDHIYDAYEDLGNPLALEDRNKLCLLITPPIPGLDYNKFMHGITMTKHILDKDGVKEELIRVFEGFLPYFFKDAAIDVQDASMDTLIREVGEYNSFEVLGCKLSPLSSGKANIAMFLKFDKQCPFDGQSYIPIHYGKFRGMKIRVIPRPFIIKNSKTKINNLDIVIKMASMDEDLFDFAFNFGNNIITHDLRLNTRHIRLNKANNELIFAGHTLDDIVITPYMQKALIRKIQLGLLPYIIRNVSFIMNTV